MYMNLLSGIARMTRVMPASASLSLSLCLSVCLSVSAQNQQTTELVVDSVSRVVIDVCAAADWASGQHDDSLQVPRPVAINTPGRPAGRHDSLRHRPPLRLTARSPSSLRFLRRRQSLRLPVPLLLARHASVVSSRPCHTPAGLFERPHRPVPRRCARVL